MVAYGGLQYGLAFGDEAKSGKAKGIITAAVAGLVIIFLSIAMVTTVWNIFLQNGNPTGPKLSYLAFLTQSATVNPNGTINNDNVPGCAGVPITDPNATGASSAKAVPVEIKSGAKLPTDVQKALKDARNSAAWRDATSNKAKKETGPCIGQFDGYRVDMVHVPRNDTIDNANQCPGYKEGDQFIELDLTTGSVVRYAKSGT